MGGCGSYCGPESSNLYKMKLIFVEHLRMRRWRSRDHVLIIIKKFLTKTPSLPHDYTFPRTIDVSKISDGIIPNHIQIIHLENTWKVWILLSYPDLLNQNLANVLSPSSGYYPPWSDIEDGCEKFILKRNLSPWKVWILLIWPPLSESGQCFIARARIYPVAAAISMKFFDCFYRCLDMSAWCLKIYILCF